MHWDATITLGSILQIVSMVLLAVAAFNAIAARLGNFETTIKDHARKLDRIDAQFEMVGTRYTELSGQLQRLIGRSEIVERRRSPRE